MKRRLTYDWLRGRWLERSEFGLREWWYARGEWWCSPLTFPIGA